MFGEIIRLSSAPALTKCLFISLIIGCQGLRRARGRWGPMGRVRLGTPPAHDSRRSLDHIREPYRYDRRIQAAGFSYANDWRGCFRVIRRKISRLEYLLCWGAHAYVGMINSQQRVNGRFSARVPPGHTFQGSLSRQNLCYVWGLGGYILKLSPGLVYGPKLDVVFAIFEYSGSKQKKKYI